MSNTRFTKLTPVQRPLAWGIALLLAFALTAIFAPAQVVTNPSGAGSISASSAVKVTTYGAINYGDSITACTGVVDCANGYAYQLDSYIGGEPQVVGISGAQSEDMVRYQMFPQTVTTARNVSVTNFAVGLYNNPINTMLIGHNDLHWCGNTAGCQLNFAASLLAAIVHKTVPVGNKVYGQATTQSAGWSADTAVRVGMGIVSTTQGSTASWTQTMTTPVAYLTWLGKDGSGGTASYSMTNGSATLTGNLTTASPNGHCICSVTGATQTIWAVRIPLPSTGAWTTTITVTSATAAGNDFTLLYGATPAVLVPRVDGPNLYLTSPIYEAAYANQAATDAYTSIIANLSATLINDTLPLKYQDSHPYMNPAIDMSNTATAVAPGTGDTPWSGTCSAVAPGSYGQHPNWCGHNNLKRLFLFMIQPSSANTAMVALASGMNSFRSYTPGLNTANAINGAWLDYKSAYALPGYEAGRAFMNAGGFFRQVDFAPTFFDGNYWCRYPVGNEVHQYSDFTWCPVHIPGSRDAGLGGVNVTVDSANQGYTIAKVSGTGAAYPVVYGPGDSNAAGIYVGVVNGDTTSVGLFSNGGANVPISAASTAPNGSLTVDANGNANIPASKSSSGVRYLCIDTNGKVVSQAAACSGT